MLDTKELAKKILSSGILDDPKQFTIKDLFCIRDSVNMLLDYFPNEKWLLDLKGEVLKYIEQKGE